MSDKPIWMTAIRWEPDSRIKLVTLTYEDGTCEDFASAEDAVRASRRKPVATWSALTERDV